MFVVLRAYVISSFYIQLGLATRHFTEAILKFEERYSTNN